MRRYPQGSPRDFARYLTAVAEAGLPEDEVVPAGLPSSVSVMSMHAARELEVEHAFRRWLIGFAKAGYGNDNYAGSGRTDNRYYLGAGITYKINRNWHLKGEYRHEWLRSSFSGNDCNAWRACLSRSLALTSSGMGGPS